MKDGKKLAFLLMSADIIHPGHLNIIHEAMKLDATIMVGLYSDEAIASYKRVPFMNFDQRKTVLENIKGVDIVIKQKTRDVRETLLKYKPDYFVHGTDWRNGALAEERENILNTISSWGGQLIEPEYTKGISSSNAHAILKKRGTTPNARQEKLFKLVEVKKHIRACSVYDCLTASIVENAVVKNVGKPIAEFDAFWVDLGQIAEIKGKNSACTVDFSELHIIMNEISDISVKPFIFNYGKIYVTELFCSAVHSLEKTGVSIVVLERNNNVALDEFGKQIKKANEELNNQNLKFAIRLDSEDLDENFLKKYEKIGLNIFVLEGSLSDIANASTIIKNLMPHSTIMAIVDSASNQKETELYNSSVNVLVYKDEIINSIKNTVNSISLKLLGI